jgi:hypothetical protein
MTILSKLFDWVHIFVKVSTLKYKLNEIINWKYLFCDDKWKTGLKTISGIETSKYPDKQSIINTLLPFVHNNRIFNTSSISIWLMPHTLLALRVKLNRIILRIYMIEYKIIADILKFEF